MAREEIHTDVLIREIESRPALYDKQMKEYNDMIVKKCLWEEIGEILFPRTWPRMNVDQKDKAVRDIQKRWKNLRACYTRELRQQRLGRDETRKKYVYFDRLNFLANSVEFHDTKPEEFDQEDFQDDYQDNEREETISITPQTIYGAKKRKIDSFIDFVDTSQRDTESINPKSVDADTHFALSIVPMLNSIPLHQKIDVQISILQILKRFMRNPPEVTVKVENCLSDHND